MDYEVNTDDTKLDRGRIYNFICKSYWAKDIPFSVFNTSLENSLNFGLYAGSEQIGFARVVSDYATFAYLGDVYIEDAYRGKGLSKMLIKEVMQHPKLQGLRRWILATVDAHGLYEKFGFKTLGNPENLMEIHRPDAYREQI